MPIMRSYKDLNIDYQGGELNIYNKQLRLLAGCPNHITGEFECNTNKLKTLVGGPQRVDKWYDCSYNQLSDLVGCASHIGVQFKFCNNTKITSLVGIHKIIKSCPDLWFDSRKIKEGGIGLLMIENLIDISEETKPFQIIQKYLGSGTKGMMECSKELKAKGYDEYAKL